MNDKFRYIKIEIKIANVHANKRRLSAHQLPIDESTGN